MFNVKMGNFLDKILNKNKREQKYLSNLIRIRSDIDEKTKTLIEKFLKASTYEELKDFLDSQNLINFQISTEDFELSFNELKEKIAYEITEAILNKS